MEYLLRNFDSFFPLKVPVVLVASSTLKTKKSRKRNIQFRSASSMPESPIKKNSEEGSGFESIWDED